MLSIRDLSVLPQIVRAAVSTENLPHPPPHQTLAEDRSANTWGKAAQGWGKSHEPPYQPPGVRISSYSHQSEQKLT